MANPWLIGASIVGGLFQSNAAKKGARAQTNAARESTAAQIEANEQARADQLRGTRRADGILRTGEQTALRDLNAGYGTAQQQIAGGVSNALGNLTAGFNAGQDYLNPLVSEGDTARAAYNFNLGIGERPDGYTGFEGSPGFTFMRDQGIDAVQGSAAASGKLFSGDTLKGIADYSTGLAQQDYGNYMARLFNPVQMGASARSSLATMAGNLGANQANMNVSRGNALATLADTYYGNRANVRTGSATNLANLWGGLGRDLSTLSLDAGASRARGAEQIGAANSAGSIAQGNALSGMLDNGVSSYFLNEALAG